MEEKIKYMVFQWIIVKMFQYCWELILSIYEIKQYKYLVTDCWKHAFDAFENGTYAKSRLKYISYNL